MYTITSLPHLRWRPKGNRKDAPLWFPPRSLKSNTSHPTHWYHDMKCSGCWTTATIGSSPLGFSNRSCSATSSAIIFQSKGLCMFLIKVKAEWSQYSVDGCCYKPETLPTNDLINNESQDFFASFFGLFCPPSYKSLILPPPYYPLLLLYTIPHMIILPPPF